MTGQASFLIRDCPRLTEVRLHQVEPAPIDWYTFIGCPNLKTVKVADDLHIQEFHVRECINFDTLPPLKVEELRINSCPKITEIPEYVEISLDLVIFGTTGLNLLKLVGRPGLRDLNYYITPQSASSPSGEKHVEAITSAHRAVQDGKIRRSQALMKLQDTLFDMGLGNLATTKRKKRVDTK